MAEPLRLARVLDYLQTDCTVDLSSGLDSLQAALQVWVNSVLHPFGKAWDEMENEMSGRKEVLLVRC